MNEDKIKDAPKDASAQPHYTKDVQQCKDNIRIDYRTKGSHGTLTLVVNKFFPCKVSEWRILGPVMKFATQDDIHKIVNYLMALIQSADNEMREISNEYVNCAPVSFRFKQCKRNFKAQKTIKAKAERNLKQLSKYTGGNYGTQS